MTELSLLRVAVEFLRQLRRDMRDNQCAFAFVTQLEHVTNTINLSDQRRFACGNPETRTQSPRAKRILQRLHQLVHAFARARRNRDASRKSLQVSVDQITID